MRVPLLLLKVAVKVLVLAVALYDLLGINDPYELTEEDRKRLQAIRDNKSLSDVVDSFIK